MMLKCLKLVAFAFCMNGSAAAQQRKWKK